MYFSVKAFNGTQRRFENLDNLTELNTFVEEWSQKGFGKFVIKAFDEQGYKSTLFFIPSSILPLVNSEIKKSVKLR